MPLTGETPRQILSRRYKVAEVELVTGNSSALDLYPLLRSQLFTKNVLSQYLFFKSDVDIEIVITSAPTQYGMVGVLLLPCGQQNRQQYGPVVPAVPELFNIFSDRMHLLNISNEEGCKLCATWPIPINFLGTQDDPGYVELWKLYLHAYAVFAMTEDIVLPKVTVEVYANFNNPKVCGQIKGDFPEEAFAQMLAEPAVDTPLITGANVAAALGIVASQVSGLAGTLSSVTKTIDTVKTIKQNVEKAASFNQAPSTEDGGNGSRTAVRPNFYGNLSSFQSQDPYQTIGDHKYSQVMDPGFVSSNKDRISINKLIRKWCIINHDELKLNASPSLYSTFSILVAPEAGSGGSSWWTAAGYDDDAGYEYGYLPFACSLYKFWRGTIEYRFMFFSPTLVSARVLFNIVFYHDVTTQTATDLSSSVGRVHSEEILVRGYTEHIITVPYMKYYQWDVVSDVTYAPLITFGIRSMQPALKGSSYLAIPFIVWRRAGSDFVFRQFDGGVVGADPPGEMVIKNSLQEVEPRKSGARMWNSIPGFQHKPWPSTNGRDEAFGQIQINEIDEFGPDTYPSDIDVLAMRMGRGKLKVTSIAPGGIFQGKSTMNLFTNAYDDGSLLDRMSCLAFWYSGTIAYKVLFPEDENYGMISASYPITKTHEVNVALGSQYYHTELGTVATDQNTFRMLEFEMPYESQYLCCPVQRTAFNSLPTFISDITNPLTPVFTSSVGLPTEESPVPEWIMTAARPDFMFVEPIPPPRLLRRFKLFGTEGAAPIYKPPRNKFQKARGQFLAETLEVLDEAYGQIDIDEAFAQTTLPYYNSTFNVTENYFYLGTGLTQTNGTLYLAAGLEEDIQVVGYTLTAFVTSGKTLRFKLTTVPSSNTVVDRTVVGVSGTYVCISGFLTGSEPYQLISNLNYDFDITDDTPSLFSWNIMLFTHNPLMPPFPTTGTISQPLWISNHKVSEDADGVTAPVWVTRSKQ